MGGQIAAVYHGVCTNTPQLLRFDLGSFKAFKKVSFVLLSFRLIVVQIGLYLALLNPELFWSRQGVWDLNSYQ